MVLYLTHCTVLCSCCLQPYCMIQLHRCIKMPRLQVVADTRLLIVLSLQRLILQYRLFLTPRRRIGDKPLRPGTNWSAVKGVWAPGLIKNYIYIHPSGISCNSTPQSSTSRVNFQLFALVRPTVGPSCCWNTIRKLLTTVVSQDEGSRSESWGICWT